MLLQLISLGGAAMILAAYGGQQLGRMDRGGGLYLGLNLVGSAILTFSAICARSLGLSVLEGAWAMISLAALLRSQIVR
jgi:hypothetical protein